MIRLVTFDLDNTLWSVDLVIGRAEAMMLEWLRPRVPEYGDLPVADKAAIGKAVLAAQPNIVHDISAWRETNLRETIKHCGYPPAVAAQLAAGAFAEFLDWRHRVEFFPGALDTLAELAGDYTLAALTNGNADFERLGLDDYFSFGYSAADVGAQKPDTAMFKRALNHAAVQPSEAVHVGDHPVDDVQGATAAGMATIWVNLLGTEEEPDATATVTRLEELPAAVAALNGGDAKG